MNFLKLSSLTLFIFVALCTASIYTAGFSTINFFYFYIPKEVWIVFSIFTLVFLFHAWSSDLYKLLAKYKAVKTVNIVLQILFLVSILTLFLNEFIEVFNKSMSDIGLRQINIELQADQLFILMLCATISGTLIWWIFSHRHTNSSTNDIDLRNKNKWEWPALCVLLILAFGVFAYQIDVRDFQSDEFQVIQAAKSFQEARSFYKWDWLEKKPGNLTDCIEVDRHCHYTRAWPHTILVSGSFALFEMSEASARMVSVLLGVIFIAVLYFFARWATQIPSVALFIAGAAVIYPSYVEIFRNTRMYALLLPLFLALIYTLYRTLSEKNHPLILNKIPSVLRPVFDFNMKWAIICCLIFFITMETHFNSLIVVPATILYFITLAFVRSYRQNFYALFSIISLTLVVIITVLIKTDILQIPFTHFLSFFGRDNTVYYEFLVQYPFSFSVGLVLYLIALFSIPFEETKKRNILIFLHIIIISSAIFFSYIADRYSGFAYISHVTPLAIIVITYSLWRLLQIYPQEIRYAVIIVFASLSLLQYTQTASSIYSVREGAPIYSQAYSTIVENFDSTKDTLFGQYPRDYYLRGLPADIERVSLLNRRRYGYIQFFEDIELAGSGWITWSTNKSYHIRPDIREYIDTNFQKLHGHGVDDTNVEVYYFDSSMIR